MNKIIQDITELTEEWYKLIAPDHHKDRDCHWYIETVWSYGNVPTYAVRHYGYILDKIEEEYDSYESALHGLKETLQYWIEKEKESNNINTFEEEC